MNVSLISRVVWSNEHFNHCEFGSILYFDSKYPPAGGLDENINAISAR